MKRFKRYLFAIVGFAGLVTAILLTTGWGSALASNVASVFVANTASNPVPVNGTVTIGNAPTVNLASGSTVGIGNSPTVNLAPGGNTVDVASSDSHPVTVADANGGQNPVSESGSVEVQPGAGSGCATGSAVPDGMRLIVEYVSAQFYNGEPSNLYAWIQDDGKHNAPLYLAPISVGTDSAGEDHYVVSQQVRDYIGAGDSPMLCVVFLHGASSAVYVSASFNGYLVKAP